MIVLQCHHCGKTAKRGNRKTISEIIPVLSQSGIAFTSIIYVCAGCREAQKSKCYKH